MPAFRTHSIVVVAVDGNVDAVSDDDASDGVSVVAAADAAVVVVVVASSAAVVAVIGDGGDGDAVAVAVVVVVDVIVGSVMLLSSAHVSGCVFVWVAGVFFRLCGWVRMTS